MIEVERRIPLKEPMMHDKKPQSTAFILDVYRTATPDTMERMRLGGKIYHNGGFSRFCPLTQYTRKELVAGQYKETDSGLLDVVYRFLADMMWHFPAAIITGVRRQFPLKGGRLNLCDDRILRYRKGRGHENLGRWIEIERMVERQEEIPGALREVQDCFFELFGVMPENLVVEPYPVVELPSPVMN